MTYRKGYDKIKIQNTLHYVKGGDILNLKQLREKKNLTQREVGKHIGISESYYSLIENGNRQPKPKIIIKLSKILGFDWKRFYE